MPDPPAGTVTFLLTDIEGSTHLWEQYPESMRRALERHDAVFAAGIEAHGGVLVRSRGEGDSFFAVFTRAADAIAAAGVLQSALHAEPWPPEVPLRVRMALHTGEADLREGQYYGTVVNRCARLRAIAHGGQVLLSLAAAEVVRDLLPDGASLRGLGTHRLRDLSRPEQVFQLVWPGLPADFPPLESLDSLPHNLPIQLTSFVDREDEVAALRGLLAAPAAASSRLVTLTGSGGCGKTRLALEVGANLVAEYPDGIWFVDLAPLSDPALVPQAVATALGVREEGDRPLVETIAYALRDKRVLLVLDNCEHLVAASASLAGRLLLACPQVRILATSREVLAIAGEVVWRVPSLPAPDPGGLPPPERVVQSPAVRLFVERAAAVVPGFSVTREQAPAIAQICRRLDGMPLAIELAAARVNVLSPEQIAGRLDASFRLLTGGGRTAPPRQQTLAALVDWSYDLLSPEEKALFYRLAVFAGGFTLEAAEAVCAGDGIPAEDVLDILARLVNKSLVTPEANTDTTPRYRLLETLRQYAAQRLVESGEAEGTRRKHAAFFLAVAERAEPEMRSSEQVAWLDRLEREHDNCRAALTWALEGREAETASRLAGALSSFWVTRGYLTEGQRWLDTVLDQSGEMPAGIRAKVLGGAGRVAKVRGDYERAADLVRESLGLLREMRDRPGIANTLDLLGMVAYENGDEEAARALYEESLVVWRMLQEKRGIAIALEHLGLVIRARGDYDRAAALHEESLQVWQELGDKAHTAYALNNLGSVKRAQGDRDHAVTLHSQSLDLWRGLGDRREIALTLVELGKLAQLQGDPHRAMALCKEGVMLMWGLGVSPYIAWCLESLAIVACAQAQPEQAARLFGASEALREASGAARAPSAQRMDHDRGVADTRAKLGEIAFTAAWAEGRAFPVDQIIQQALALETTPPDTERPTPTTGSSGDAAGAAWPLTPRERQVAVLIARGLTNRQIASRLVITERTAHSHVENILAKLGLRSRVQVAAWVVEHKLTGRESQD